MAEERAIVGWGIMGVQETVGDAEEGLEHKQQCQRQRAPGHDHPPSGGGRVGCRGYHNATTDMHAPKYSRFCVTRHTFL